ncbi:MAG: hypothetical protein ACD_76C00015G0005 [uncultured bacterium]|nr:MAG: hypothetical protein ACD_76C00015G0005 [uncultured bacterium]HBD05060.1 hypothetical protein [Candidatus Uhrbacteria bacterium]
MSKKIIVAIRAAIILAPMILFVFLSYKFLMPSGIMSIKHKVYEKSPFIDSMLPKERVTDNFQDKDKYQTIIDEPVYASLHLPRNFESLDVELVYRSKNQPIVEIGALADSSFRFALKPLQNSIIDDSNWSRIDENGIVLLQSEKKFSSVSEFLDNPPSRNKIATYHFDPVIQYRIFNYKPTSEIREISADLCGPHSFYTYIKDEDLNFNFTVQDANQTKGEDTIIVQVFDELGNGISESILEDDGVTDDSGELSQIRAFDARVQNLSEGLYKVDVRSTSDIIIRSIKTTQQKFSFIRSICFADSQSPVRWFGESRDVRIKAQTANGVQDVNVDGQNISILRAGEEYSASAKTIGIYESNATNGGITIQSDGMLSLDSAMYFQPELARVSLNTDLAGQGIEYIIAKYAPPERDGEWLIGKATFMRNEVLADKGEMKLVISVPGIDEFAGAFDVREINIVLHRKPLTITELVRAIKEKLF